MKFTITEKSGVEVEIKTPSFYTHYGGFYKLTETNLIIVSVNTILAVLVSNDIADYHIRAIMKGDYGEISQGLFVDQFDKTIESLSKFRL